MDGDLCLLDTCEGVNLSGRPLTRPTSFPDTFLPLSVLVYKHILLYETIKNTEWEIGMRFSVTPCDYNDEPSASVFFAIVTSSATTLLSVPELCDLLLTGRSCCRRYNLTGILLYKDGNFMQLLEGDQANVRQMLALSAYDPRQLLITPTLEGFTSRRQCPDWTMAFPIDDFDDMRFISGYNNFLNTPLTNDGAVSHLTKAQKLLLAFKRYVGDAV